MSYSTIAVNGANVTLVAFPTSPGLSSLDVSIKDATATVTSPYTGQTQAQQWPGGDMMSATATLPPLQRADADNWEAALMQCRGMAYAFQMGDPMRQTPRGTPSGSPQCSNGSANNAAMSTFLDTTGWTSSTGNLLLTGDWIQVGYRLHRVMDPVSSDSGGNATINIWPSLREAPASNANVITSGTQGLWRLASNQRDWSFDYTGFTHISFKLQEYR